MADELDIDTHIDILQRLEGATFMAMKDIVEEVKPTIRDVVAGILERRYANSGMKVRTGKMIRAIRDVSVRIRLFGKRPSIIYSLPSGIAPYKGSDTSFYKVFMGLSYGAIRMPGGSKKDKRSIKKKLLKKGRKGDKSFFVGKYQVTGNIIKTVDENDITKTSTAIVTRPKEFWQMSRAEESQVRNLLVEEMDLALKRRK